MTTEKFTLYVVPVSPNCRRVEATVHHLGFRSVTKIIRLSFGSEQFREEQFLSLNPNGKVPILRHGNHAIWESLAIMHYLAHVSRDEVFLPADPKTQVEIIRWQMWESMHFNRAVGAICWETLVRESLGRGKPDENAIAKGIVDFKRFAPVLERQLEGQTFILSGSSPSLADFAVASHSALILNPKSGIPLDEFPNIKRWYETIERLPAWQASASV